ncbi:MAG: Gfo/Idh/MocA family oxidoreductase [Thermoguttaceae bacterium]|jgi:predicted dehydrogenase
MPNRREFLQTGAATGIGFWLTAGTQAKASTSPNERIAMASVGIGGKGDSDSHDADRNGDMVAVCDVDTNQLKGAERKFAKAKRYTDFRKMLDEMGKSIDAVTVSTPDHCHAVAAATAMHMGKHCFVQKPLTHTLHEARTLGQLARELKLATQMGNQGTSNDGLRRAAALVQAGALGKVTEAHIWTNRPIWPQGGSRSQPRNPPDSLKWDLWLGPAPTRPYGDNYHPFAWRGWWDFGTGALGDMACHTVNMPFAALHLRDPISVQAKSSGHNKDSYPKWSVIAFEFPATEQRPAVKMFWYDGGQRPPKDLFEGRDPSGSGAMIIGEKGKLFSPGDYCDGFQLLGNVTEPKVKYKHSPGHFEEWIRAIRGGEPAMSNFPDYAGPLTETILLGNLAVWVAASGQGEKVEWDAKNQKVTNITGLEPVIQPTYRPGYSL